jgi:hypothetical protein
MNAIPMTTREFLQSLFEYKADEHLIQIFQTPWQRTSRFSSIDAAVSLVERLSKTQANIYFCCGLTDNLDLGPDKRGEKKDIRAVPGLWMDVDVADPLHKKTNLPQTVEEAIALIDKVPVKPTLIVSSGHGLHAYWLFKEPWIFADDAERTRFEGINFRLQAFIRAEAGKSGWQLDSTYDCTRILRIVGTTNYKDESNPKPVELLVSNDFRYTDAAEFEMVLPENVCPTTSQVEREHVDQISKGITIAPTAEPPQMKLEMMLEADINFKASWYAKRSDFEKQSPSEYIMSIANLAVRAFWNDQEISDLIVAWYRRNAANPMFASNDMTKWNRKGYIAHTIAKARESWEAYKAKSGYDCMLEDPTQPDQPPKPSKKNDGEQPETPEQEADSTRIAMGSAIGWTIHWLKKYEQEDATTYIMLVEKAGVKKEIKFKTVDQLTQQNLFSKRFMEITNQLPIKASRAGWAHIVETMHLFMKTEKVSNESTTKGRIKAWLRQYLEDAARLPVEQAVKNKDPFIKNGSWYIFSAPFKRWTFHACGVVDGASKLHLDFKLCGIVERSVNYTKPGSTQITACHAWQVPKSIVDPEDPSEKTDKIKTPVLQLVQTPQDGMGEPVEDQGTDQIKVG